jgi:hypothetical protein
MARTYPFVDSATLIDWARQSPAQRKLIAGWYREQQKDPEWRKTFRMVKQITREAGRAGARRYNDVWFNAKPA